MALGVADFFEFITRPFTNPMGWIMLFGVGLYIYFRVTGKIKRKEKGGGKGGNLPKKGREIRFEG